MQNSGLQLDDWLARLETYSPQEIDLGLERVELLLQRLAPDLPNTVFLIAGTNGKGSSVALLEAMLRRSQARIGAYTSPHLYRYNERVRVDGVEVSDAELVAAFEQVEAQRKTVPLTYFEFGTLAALLIFAERKVDVAILEIGLGGRLDAVNAVEPTASLITNVALDHCDWLGDNVEDIAREKAGVMRGGKPVVFAASEMPDAIVTEAEAHQARLIAAGRDYEWTVDADGWSWQGVRHVLHDLAKPALQGDIQVQNAAGVLSLLEAVGMTELLEPATVNVAFATASLAGRAQVVADRFLLDVAHNPAAAVALARTVESSSIGRSRVTILGMLNDKDVAGVVAALAGVTEHWLAVRADSSRAIAADELAGQISAVTGRACETADSMAAALERAADLAGDDEQVLITGSFYTVGAALVILAAPGSQYG